MVHKFQFLLLLVVNVYRSKSFVLTRRRRSSLISVFSTPFSWSEPPRNSTIASLIDRHNTDHPYRSNVFATDKEYGDFLESLKSLPQRQSYYRGQHQQNVDLFWEQIKLEASHALAQEPDAGPQLYQGILSHTSILTCICTIISHEIQTELIPATQLKYVFLEMLTPQDEIAIRMDLQAVAKRSAIIDGAAGAVLFHNGFHALVCYRVGHRLWQAQRQGLAYYMQSTVSRKYSMDIHPACKMGEGIYLRAGAGVVIGETAIVSIDDTVRGLLLFTRFSHQSCSVD